MKAKITEPHHKKGGAMNKILRGLLATGAILLGDYISSAISRTSALYSGEYGLFGYLILVVLTLLVYDGSSNEGR